MARILSVPDVHGSHEWEVVKILPKNSYDYIVFHGDYFDAWENEWPDQEDNFKAICNFIREDTEHRKLLIGNHDWSYLSQSREGSNCSGHQTASFNREGKVTIIRELLLNARDILELAFRPMFRYWSTTSPIPGGFFFNHTSSSADSSPNICSR